MLLGLAYHATYAWLPDVAPWYFVADASPVPWLVTVTGALHAFRMQLFFTLSGFFSHLVLERRGAGGFLRDRVRRLVVPFAVALPLVWWADHALRSEALARGLMAASYAPQAAWRFTPAHLWFLVYLFAFCVAAWLLARAGLGRGAVLRPLAGRPWVLLGLVTLPTSLLLLWHPEPRPDAHLWPMPLEVLHYGLFFAVGWLLWPLREELSALTRVAPVFAAAGLLVALVDFGGRLQWQPVGHALSGAVAWLLTLGGFGLALRVPDGERPVVRFLVESSYWVYLVHYPVVLGLQLVFAQVSWPGALEYGATVVLTAGFAFVTFALLVKPTALGPWLGVRRSA
jgi:peptidoglycan/LPS O-acetylase OafA/YrhL